MDTTARSTSDAVRRDVAAWYRRPGLPRTAPAVRVVDHDTDRGFCSVCGAVWPCARARREQRQERDPFPVR